MFENRLHLRSQLGQKSFFMSFQASRFKKINSEVNRSPVLTVFPLSNCSWLPTRCSQLKTRSWDARIQGPWVQMTTCTTLAYGMYANSFLSKHVYIHNLDRYPMGEVLFSRFEPDVCLPDVVPSRLAADLDHLRWRPWRLTRTSVRRVRCQFLEHGHMVAAFLWQKGLKEYGFLDHSALLSQSLTLIETLITIIIIIIVNNQ